MMKSGAWSNPVMRSARFVARKLTFPAVSYYYDDIATNPGNYCGAAGAQKATAPFIDSLVQVASTASTTSVTGVDALRRVTAGTQLTLGQLYSFSYGYNEQGSLTSQTNPSGRVSHSGLRYIEPAHEPVGQRGNGATTSYVAGATYWGHGAIRSMTVGPKLTETGKNSLAIRDSNLSAGSVDTRNRDRLQQRTTDAVNRSCYQTGETERNSKMRHRLASTELDRP